MTTVICFDKHRAAGDRKVWCVRHAGRWHLASHLRCVAPIESRYRGAHARQPRGYWYPLVPVVVERDRHLLVIRPA